MKVSVEKPGSPGDILEHFGVKGQKWGVRKAVETSSNVRSRAQTILTKRAVARANMTPAARAAQTEHRKKIAKRVAVGVSVAAVVAGTAFVAYKLHQNNQLKMSQLRRRELLADHENSVAEILANATGAKIEVLRG